MIAIAYAAGYIFAQGQTNFNVKMAKSAKVVFSGIQPSGKLTLGNYLGAIKQWVKLQQQHKCIFCIVDLHSITTPQNPETLRQNILFAAAIYLASGIMPDKHTIFVQSAVSEHAELAWILGCSTPVGWLNRMTQFKDKAGKHKEQASLGLYAYPTLMAADILLYHASLVPVGEDQTQHLELTRDIAGAFNRQFDKDYFKLPDSLVDESTTRIMSLKDGTKKMSKSDPNDGSRVNLMDSNDAIAQKIKKAKTDAIVGITYDKTNRPEITNLVNIYSGVTGRSIEDSLAELKSLNNAQFKAVLTEAVIQAIAPVRDKALELLREPEYLKQILDQGATEARHVAKQTIREVKEIVGLSN